MRIVQAGIGAVILPAALVFAPAKFPVPHVGWMWVVALTIAAGWWTAARLAARRLDKAAALGASLTAATLVVALGILVPPVAAVTTARDLAQALNRSGQFPPELWLVEQRRGSLVFYLDPALRRGLTADRVLQLSSPQVPEHEPVPGTLVAVTVADSARLSKYVPLEGQPFELAGHYRITTASACSTRGRFRPTCRIIGLSARRRPPMVRPAADARAGPYEPAGVAYGNFHEPFRISGRGR